MWRISFLETYIASFGTRQTPANRDTEPICASIPIQASNYAHIKSVAENGGIDNEQPDRWQSEYHVTDLRRRTLEAEILVLTKQVAPGRSCATHHTDAS